jgi:hypothetical protein
MRQFSWKSTYSKVPKKVVLYVWEATLGKILTLDGIMLSLSIGVACVVMNLCIYIACLRLIFGPFIFSVGIH